MSHQDGIQSEEISLQWVLSRTTFQELLSLEVDTVVLCRELTKLVDLSTRIVSSLHALRASPLVREHNNSEMCQ